MGLRDYTIYDLICRNAVLYPERDCIVFDHKRVTHKAYKDACDRLAAGLLQAGVVAGDRLGVVAHNSDQYLILYGAAAKIGAIVLAVNWRFQQDEMAYVLNDAGPKLVFSGPNFQKDVAAACKKIDTIKNCYAIGAENASDGFLPFEDLYTDLEADADIDVSADAGFVIIHTAAVSGRPRGALLSQKNIFNITLQSMQSENLNPDDCHICILPLFHIAGLALAMSTMHAGGKNVILAKFDAQQALKLIETEKGTTFFNFAPILKMLIDKYDALGGQIDVSSIRSVGGLDHPDNIKRFKQIAPNVSFRAGFGQTEAMLVTSARYEERPGSAGKPTPISRVALFDDHDNEIPVGAEGEICVRGPAVFLGYWGLEEETAYTFRNDWHHTGDIGRFDSDGYLWYVKRKSEKELIKPGGENVYPVEVEKVILSHAAVAEASVIGVADRQWGEAIKAVCVLKDGAALTEKTLTDFVVGKIARYKKPKFVTFVNALPKKDDGTIDRDQVKKEHGGKY
jgi:acyl-CoA synthetase (AMP-forming)/AMP-acid ligase II